MGLFKRKRKIHLSPRLASLSGKSPLTQKQAYHKLISAVLCLVLIVVVLGKIKNNSQANIDFSTAAGSVLGTEDSKYIHYNVRSGDTLTDISKKFNVYWLTIVEENNLESPYTLHPKQILKIPAPK